MQHSRDGEQPSFRTVDDAVFRIDPEYLTDTELDYELRIRALPASGDRREKTRRIRDAIKNEEQNPQPIAFASVGTASTELNFIHEAIGRLQYILEFVNREPSTQQRFMSLFLHVDGRAQRIRVHGNSDESTRVFNCHEKLSEIHNIFVQNRKRQPPAVTMRRQNVAFQPQTVEEIESRLAHRLSLDASQNPDPLGTNIIQTRPRSFAGQSNVRPEIVISGRANEDNENNFSNENENPQLYVPLRVNVENENNGQNFHATLLTNDDARLSGQFQRTNGPLLTPIVRPVANDPLARFLNGLNGFVGIEDIFEDGERTENGRSSSVQGAGNISSVDNGTENVLQQNQIENDRAIDMTVNNRIHRETQENRGMENRNDRLQQNGTFNVPRQNEDLHIVAPQAAPLNINDRRERQSFVNEPPRAYQERVVPPQPRPRNVNNVGQIDRNIAPQAIGEEMSVRAQMNEMRQAIMNLTAIVAQQFATPRDNGHNNQVEARRHSRERDTWRYVQAENGNNNRQEQNAPTFNRTFTGPQPANVTRNYSNFDTRKSCLPVHKWPIKFNGDKQDKRIERRDLTAFCRQVETYARSEKVDYDEIFGRAIHLLDGKARTWYMQYGNRYRNWFELCAGLKSHFETDLTHYEKTQIMHDRKQYRTESCMDYISAMTQLFEELRMHDEKEKLAIIQNGLREEFVLIAHAFRGETVEELDKQLRRLELSNAIRRKGVKQEWKPTQKVFTTEANEDTPSESNENSDTDNNETSNSECAAVNHNFKSKSWSKRSSEAPRKFEKFDKQPQSEHSERGVEREAKKLGWKCFNCHESGHGFADCPDPVTRTFCFRCGRDGVVAPECGCKSKNA